MNTSATPSVFDDGSTPIGGLTLESSAEGISVYGSLDIRRDRQGLEHLRSLLKHLKEVEAALQADAEAGLLPDEAPVSEAPVARANPFL